MSAEVTSDVAKAASVLRAGGLVAFATETVYGLGANALDEQAVARIFEAKGRPTFDPLIVHLVSASEVEAIVKDVPDVARRLAQAFWPGPLTLVLPKQDCVPDLVTSGLPSVGVRVPEHPVARELIQLAGCPVAAPSANLFGRTSPTTAAHVAEQLGERIDLILDGGPCRVGIESTVLDLVKDPPTLLRPGGVTYEELTKLLGEVSIAGPDIGDPAHPAAPGMLTQHYAPRTPLLIISNWYSLGPLEGVSALAFQSIPEAERFQRTEVLAPHGDLRQAANRFFAALRRLDRPDCRLIVAELFPDTGLGVALNDRLRRAAASHAQDS
ncbi:MAG: threonylcarbamoyl-AMP synthase [Planctomycetaceae bacterium]|nr:threonylcarbamoyl-AMP synthase [Planctomycetaceae bacterium]